MTSPSLSRLFFISVIALILSACGPENNSDQSSNSSVEAVQNFNWKMVTTWPPGFPVLQEGAERFADNVKAMSNKLFAPQSLQFRLGFLCCDSTPDNMLYSSPSVKYGRAQ